ncbi:hypothetical protein BU23DRAFT_487732, partial [Bimuria novae-zelandiae CBS 107.79]
TNNAHTRRSKGEGNELRYKDLEVARANREAKDHAATRKAKRCHKRKTTATEQADAGPSAPRRRASAANEVEQANATAVSWVAPVAKMYSSL